MNSRFCSPGKLLPYLFYLLVSFILMLCWRPVQAQQRVPLSISDSVPDITIQNVLNYKSSTAKISDFRGKLLILDFWATWCKPCVMMIPKMDSLEKQFHGQVVFLPVSYQSKQEISVFREKLAKRTGQRITGPEVVSDVNLKALFPHSGVPHYVWIGPDGVLRAITNLDEIRTENIQAVLNGNGRTLAVKKDAKRLTYNRQQMALSDFLVENSDVLAANTHRSVLTGYIAGIGGGGTLHKPVDSLDHWRVTFTNLNPQTLFANAYGKGRRFFSSNTVSVEVKDSLSFFHMGQKARDWMPLHCYCYELIVPSSLADSGYRIMQKDLNRLFPQYQATLEIRQKKVLALIRTSKIDKVKSASDTYSDSYDGFTYKLRRGKLEHFVTGLNGMYMQSSPLEIVDQTGYEGYADLDMEVKFSDLQNVNAALSKYDLQLIEKSESREILVIRDRIAYSTTN
ncbi:hypothetical protein DSL64_21515 [Dyadobacter luteus]|uniref:Thioredoxin domain-containing protein n=1 Tax=Dyadobacter luteus TaxID=2259619 RepID=A0A3D8Y6H7_9BACT|nr:TlpA disulfide reductase family protein [Dyadobacter luteus]REA58189.1 hypothetical protein DSL64_21515 [Dyadobacter luteus]